MYVRERTEVGREWADKRVTSRTFIVCIFHGNADTSCKIISRGRGKGGEREDCRIRYDTYVIFFRKKKKKNYKIKRWNKSATSIYTYYSSHKLSKVNVSIEKICEGRERCPPLFNAV